MPALAPAWGAAALHAGAALACAWAARSASAPGAAWPAGARPGTAGVAQRALAGDAASSALWRAACAMLLVLALNALLHADRLLVLVLRDAARAGGWYAWRRPLQGSALVTLVLIAVLALLRWRQQGTSGGVPRHAGAGRPVSALRPGHTLGRAGLALLLTLAAVRLVSLHHTDLLLDHRVLGLSVGRWIEGLGLLALTAGAAQAARHRDDRPARAWRRDASQGHNPHV